ncbi:MuDR family transposase [Perilla frutescens var. hirtella]|nr:MuDR family transposase [Perilla frutescens var. hirtella]
MVGKRIIAICQSGGEFESNAEGILSYKGGDAHAMEIDEKMKFKDFKSEVAEMFNCNLGTLAIKYFLPGNKKTLISISNDKDLKRMIKFHDDSDTAEIYVMTEEIAAPDVSHMPGSRSSRTTLSEAEVPVDASPSMVDNIVGDINKPGLLLDAAFDVVGDTNHDEAQIDVPTEMPIPSEMPISSEMPLPISFTASYDEKHTKAAQQWQNNITGVGQRFNSVHEFREALRKYAIAHQFAFKYKKNDSHRVTVKCKAEGCPWRIHASRLSTTPLICIKKMNPTHTCEGSVLATGYQATRSWVASIIKEKLKVFPNYKPKDIVNDIKQEYGVQLNYFQAWRGKEIAKEQLQGSYKEAYSQLPLFCEKIMETNPGSLATFTTKEDSSFHRLFVSFHACLYGFEQDREKGLRESIAEIFMNEDVYHAFCLRYLSEQLLRDLNGQFSHEVKKLMVEDLRSAAVASTPEGFQRHVESIKNISVEAYNWAMQSEPVHWANAFFQGARYNHMTSDFGEQFYSWASDAHELPITQMVDAIRNRIMELIYSRQTQSVEWLTRLTPSMEEKLEQESLKAGNLELIMSSGNRFQVRGDTIEAVDVDSCDCTCKGWRLTGLPCCHAIVVIGCHCRDPYDYCSRYFTTDSYRITYSQSVNPITSVDGTWQKDMSQLAVTVTPPPTRRPPGRPTTKRVSSQDVGRRQLQCSRCKGTGHNKSTCKEFLLEC